MKRLKNKKFIEMMVVGLLVLAAVITGIYFIPDEKLANILSTILAALISGSLRFRASRGQLRLIAKKDRREEALKCKPMFRYCDVPNENIPEDALNFFLSTEKSRKNNILSTICASKILDNANFIIESVEVNDILLKPLGDCKYRKGKIFSYIVSLAQGAEWRAFY